MTTSMLCLIRSLTNLLDNDTVLDDAKIFSVDSSSSSGSVVLNDDLSITYTPQSDSTQDDSFVYTICDDDSPTPSCSSANVYVTVLEPVELNVPDDLLYYYGCHFQQILVPITSLYKILLKQITQPFLLIIKDMIFCMMLMKIFLITEMSY